MKKLIVFIAIALCTVSVCNGKLRKKAETMTGSDINAELIWYGTSIGQCLNIFNPESLAVVSRLGTVSVGSIQKSEYVFDNKKDIQFPAPCKQYYSLKNGSYIWGFGLRDFYTIDLTNGNMKETVVSNNGNTRIVQVDIINYNKPTLYIDVVKSNWGNDIQTGRIYDLFANKLLDTTNDYSGEIFPLPDGKLLFEKFSDTLPSVWKIGSGFNSGLQENKLTDELNRLGITVWAVSYSYSNNFMIGFNDAGEETIYYTIKWHDDFEDVTIEPFTYQRDPEQILWDHFELSPDGKWAKTVARNRSSGMQREDTITFFSINDSFPQSLSLPVYGGQSSRNGGGCFLETVDWGTVYIDISPDKPGFLVVYKMRDVMAKVVEKMRKLAK